MTKKSLSDLLKEEVNKADAPDSASTPAAESGEKEAAKAAPEAAAKAAMNVDAVRTATDIDPASTIVEHRQASRGVNRCQTAVAHGRRGVRIVRKCTIQKVPNQSRSSLVE